VTSCRAVGLLVTFEDEGDGERHATAPRDRDHITWCRADDPRAVSESAQIVALGSATAAGRRAVVHPAPMDSELWGTLSPDDRLRLYEEDRQIGRASVAWVHDLEPGLQPTELRALVHWTQAGGPSPFPL
jgi:hypothetical protein